MAIAAGKLNRRISIQTQVTTPDNFGQPVTAWTTAYTCWTSIDVQNSQLVYSTAEFIEKATYRFTVRWTSSFVFSPNQRIVYSETATGITHTYIIDSIVNVKAGNRELLILAHEYDGSE